MSGEGNEGSSAGQGTERLNERWSAIGIDHKGSQRLIGGAVLRCEPSPGQGIFFLSEEENESACSFFGAR